MRETIRALLAEDGTLAGLLTGGVWAEVEISRQATPGAFDANGEIKPCALVALSDELPTGPYPTGSLLNVEVYFFQRAGYDVIDPALERAYALLHRTKADDTSGVWEMIHARDALNQGDQALGCSRASSRYVVTRLR